MIKKILKIAGITMVLQSSINLTIKAEESNDAYILKTGEQGAQALELQQQIFGQDSYDHLTKASLCMGQTVWDIGCGNGTMTEYLAKAIGRNGHVYAVDISQDQINLTKERLAKLGLNNVTFI